MGKKEKIGPLALWSLVAGGMVGGGIYTALGVVVALAGQWAWLSLLLAGLVAIPSAVSYCRLSNHFEESGGAFKFLERMRREGMAGSLAWILLLGYVLTIALYAFAFGHYVAFALHLGAVGTRVLALGILLGLTVLNLVGVAKMKQLELSTVVLNFWWDWPPGVSPIFNLRLWYQASNHSLSGLPSSEPLLSSSPTRVFSW